MLTLTLTACSNHDGLYAPVDNPKEGKRLHDDVLLRPN